MPPHNDIGRPSMISLVATGPIPDLNKSAENSPLPSPDLLPSESFAVIPPISIMDKGQDELPSLPIPPLDQTLDRYLESVRPLATDLEYENTVAAVEEFRRDSHENESGQDQGQGQGQGRSLDLRLREHALGCERRKTSWLAEWWDDWAYFSHRDSSTFFVNYYFGFQDDPRMPTQTARAALLVSLALEFRQLIAT
ncbi:Carnitine O-acetyltransferase mitochondrial, partial [Entomortierella chlamydospora]